MKLSTIDDICDLITDGTHYTPPDAGSGVPFLTVKDMSPQGLDFINCSMITSSDFAIADAGNSSPKSGDVLFSKDGTVGKVHVVTETTKFAVLSSIAILRPKRAICDPTYLGHVLQSPSAIEQAARSKTGSAIRRLILSDLRRLRVPLPPHPEQRRIAAILDKADHVRTKRREALAHLDALTLSIFQSAFGSENPASLTWPEIRLDALGRVVTGKTPPARLGAEASGTFRPFVTPGDLEQLTVKRGISELGAEHAPAVDAGSLLVCCIGATIGKMGIAAHKSSFNQQINAVEWNNQIISSYGFYAALKLKNAIRANSSSTTMPILNKTEFSKLTIAVPPLELQQSFARRVAGVERLKEKHRTQLAKLDILFASLQHRAFRGEL